MTWLFSKALMDSVSLPCSPEPVAEYSAATFSDGEPSAQWNVMPTPQGFWRNDKMMDASRLSQFGPTLRLLTASHGEAVLMSFLAAFPARTSALPEKGKASPASGPAFGLSSLESLAKYDPDTCSWRTPQFSLLGDWELYSETWPRWGSMRAGECWVQPMSELRTNGTESGLWPTPIASDWKGSVTPETAARRSQESPRGVRLPEEVTRRAMVWPTPKANDAEKRGNFDVMNPRNGLPAMVKRFTTPCADDIGHRKAKYAQGGTPLSMQAGGQLNPVWVELLMGWPAGWTDLEPLCEEEFYAWFNGFAGQDVRGVRESIQSAPNAERQTAGCEPVYGSEVLQSELRKQQEGAEAQKLSLASAEIQEEPMRSLRVCEATGGASLRPGSHEQRSRQLADSVQPLPRLLARYGQEAWKDGSWENALPRVVSGMSFRVDRLKALGNGQVSRVAAAAFTELSD